MPLSFIPDFKERALRDLLSQFRSSPRITALISAVMAGAQSLEDEMLDFVLAFRIDSASGDQLDILADIVGEQRGGLDDIQLRRIVRARVAANRSNGSIADVYNVFRLATTGPDPEDRVLVWDEYPANFTLEVISVRQLTDEEKRRAQRLVLIAKPLGVGERLISSYNNSLRFHPRGSGRATFDGPQFSSLFPAP